MTGQIAEETPPPLQERPVQEPHGRPGISLVTQVFGGLVLSFAWAVLCNALVDFLQSGGSFSWIWSYELGPMHQIFFISSGIVWALLALLVAVTNRLFVSAGLLLAAFAIAGMADYQKLQLRSEPLYPSDLVFLKQIGFLREMVPLRLVLMAGLGTILLILVPVLVGRIAGRRFPRPSRVREPRLWTAWTAARVLVGVSTLAFLVTLHTFNQPGNPVRRAYESSGASWAFWFQKVNYARHGFIAGFLYNMPTPAMAEPQDYSAATMAELARRYSAPSPTESTGSADVEQPNVVVVLSEAFSDPLRVRGVSLARDPIPRTRALMKTTTSGNMLAQLLGGGTANMEFETLTGQSLSQFYPQMNTPYQMLVPTLHSYPSVVGYLRGQGTPAVAVHPYMTTMYKRYEVYPELGFQRFVHDSSMQQTRKIDKSGFISDKSAYDEVLHQLEEERAPALINLVTMQNHYPMKDEYTDPIKVLGPSSLSREEREQLAHYARGLDHTDEATADFLAQLKRSGEPTVVVFYGDHLPAFWAPETSDANSVLTMRQTPYFMWSSSGRLPAKHEELTSPIYFLPLLWKELGLPLPPYYRLLLELHREIPAMEQGEYHLADGRTVTEDELPPPAARLLHDYRLVQYDFSIGKRYAVPEMFPQK